MKVSCEGMQLLAIVQMRLGQQLLQLPVLHLQILHRRVSGTLIRPYFVRHL
jgi:hypothetical protein